MREILQKQREYFNTFETYDIQFRIDQLKNLKNKILEKQDDLFDAFKKDMNKCEFEVVATELGLVMNELNYLIKNLKGLATDRTASSSILNYPAKNFQIFEPYGLTLVVSPWNYPFQLTLIPVMGAISGGNTVIVKPSRNTPNVTRVIKDILSIFPENYVYVVTANDEIDDLFDQNFDFIFYTGSGKVGRELLARQAKYITPMILELGGKCPCIVSSSANINAAAKRIAFGKFLNAGQTCVAPDFILIDKKIKAKFITKLIHYVKAFYYKDGVLTDSFVNIINENALDNILTRIDVNKIIFGGDVKGLMLEPTILDNVTYDDDIMQDEIFGPVLPIIEYTNINEAIEYLRTKPKPLALYYFGQNQKEGAEVLKKCPSGGGCINEVVMHVAEHGLPFGGVGESGIGSYHGAKTFYSFVHAKSVLKRSTWFDFKQKYPPYTEKKLKFAKSIFGVKNKDKDKPDNKISSKIEEEKIIEDNIVPVETVDDGVEKQIEATEEVVERPVLLGEEEAKEEPIAVENPEETNFEETTDISNLEETAMETVEEVEPDTVESEDVDMVEPETVEEVVEDEPSEETKVVEEAQEVVEPVETAEVLDDQPKVEEYNNAKEEEVIISDGEMTLENAIETLAVEVEESAETEEPVVEKAVEVEETMDEEVVEPSEELVVSKETAEEETAEEKEEILKDILAEVSETLETEEDDTDDDAEQADTLVENLEEVKPAQPTEPVEALESKDEEIADITEQVSTIDREPEDFEEEYDNGVEAVEGVENDEEIEDVEEEEPLEDVAEEAETEEDDELRKVTAELEALLKQNSDDEQVEEEGEEESFDEPVKEDLEVAEVVEEPVEEKVEEVVPVEEEVVEKPKKTTAKKTTTKKTTTKKTTTKKSTTKKTTEKKTTTKAKSTTAKTPKKRGPSKKEQAQLDAKKAQDDINAMLNLAMPGSMPETPKEDADDDFLDSLNSLVSQNIETYDDE